MVALDPMFSVGYQLTQPIRRFRGVGRAEARRIAAELLGQVGIVDAGRMLRSYPHQLSGGMAQRVCIALALTGSPKLLIADEPTTALDVTVQAEILSLLRALVRTTGLSVIIVSHDPGVVADLCDEVAVMYAGQVVESGTVAEVLGHAGPPLHRRPARGEPARRRGPAGAGTAPVDPRDRARAAGLGGRVPVRQPLLAGHRRVRGAGPGHTSSRCCQPRCCQPRAGTVRCVHPLSSPAELPVPHPVERGVPSMNALVPAPSVPVPSAPALSVRDLTVRYGGAGKTLPAVNGVSFDVAPGETLGLVGESGSGKSTIGKAILGLQPPEHRAGYLLRRTTSPGRRYGSAGSPPSTSGVVFQDPYSSLNPAQTIGQTLTEPLQVLPGAEEGPAAAADPGVPGGGRAARRRRRRYPARFSGGQRQRIAIARALVCDPQVIVLDEPVSALDLSTQAQVLNLLADLRDSRQLALLFIAHDLGVVRFLAQRVVVLYRGQVMEAGGAEEVTQRPRHPYSIALTAAAPVPQPAEQARRRAAREALGVGAAGATPPAAPAAVRHPLPARHRRLPPRAPAAGRGSRLPPRRPGGRAPVPTRAA